MWREVKSTGLSKYSRAGKSEAGIGPLCETIRNLRFQRQYHYLFRNAKCFTAHQYKLRNTSSKTVLLSNPTYQNAVHILESSCNIENIDLQSDGWDMRSLEEILQSKNTSCVCHDEFPKSNRYQLVYCQKRNCWNLRVSMISILLKMIVSPISTMRKREQSR